MAWSTSNKTSMDDVIVGQHHASPSSTAKKGHDAVSSVEGIHLGTKGLVYSIVVTEY